MSGTLNAVDKQVLQTVTVDQKKAVLGFSTLERLQEKVNVPLEFIQNALNRLQRSGLIEEHSRSRSPPYYEKRYIATRMGFLTLKRN
ncbi:MAG: hypothetical protein M1286_01050 [Candidatus Marsarchaeota archaeon]|nr:hypothetical protein [Candidatus Marsarchaeota archaeon]